MGPHCRIGDTTSGFAGRRLLSVKASANPSNLRSLPVLVGVQCLVSDTGEMTRLRLDSGPTSQPGPASAIGRGPIADVALSSAVLGSWSPPSCVGLRQAATLTGPERAVGRPSVLLMVALLGSAALYFFRRDSESTGVAGTCG